MIEKVQACPLRDWPTADRETWDRACLAGRRLRPGGAAARMKSSTQTSLMRAYGYLLEFCWRNGLFNENAKLAGHVTPKIIDAFVHDLHGRVGSVTRAIYISKIRRIAKILSPECDLVWLHEIEADLRYEAGRGLSIIASSRLTNCWRSGLN